MLSPRKPSNRAGNSVRTSNRIGGGGASIVGSHPAPARRRGTVDARQAPACGWAAGAAGAGVVAAGAAVVAAGGSGNFHGSPGAGFLIPALFKSAWTFSLGCAP